jgi:glucose dehydrogenase
MLSRGGLFIGLALAGSLGGLTLAGSLWGLTLAASLGNQVSFERLLRANDEPQNWLTYSGTFRSQRHTPLTQITPANARDLELQWVFQAASLQKFEATPLVVDGVMYTVSPPNNVVALDAATGTVFWVYRHRPSPEVHNCCGNNNRGLAILGNTLFMGTIDNRRAEVGDAGRTVRGRLFDHACSAGGEGQGHHRHGRRRVWNPRIHRGV